MSLNPVRKLAHQDTKQGKEDDVETDANYFGPVYPEAPKFRDPEDDLLRIGITRVASLKRVDLIRSRKGWNRKLAGNV
jgi:hypothetical protein